MCCQVPEKKKEIPRSDVDRASKKILIKHKIISTLHEGVEHGWDYAFCNDVQEAIGLALHIKMPVPHNSVAGISGLRWQTRIHWDAAESTGA